jgi:hypothetical protein
LTVEVSDAVTDDSEAAEAEELRELVLVLRVCPATKPTRSTWKARLRSRILTHETSLFRLLKCRT